MDKRDVHIILQVTFYITFTECPKLVMSFYKFFSLESLPEGAEYLCKLNEEFLLHNVHIIVTMVW